MYGRCIAARDARAWCVQGQVRAPEIVRCCLRMWKSVMAERLELCRKRRELQLVGIKC